MSGWLPCLTSMTIMSIIIPKFPVYLYKKHMVITAILIDLGLKAFSVNQLKNVYPKFQNIFFSRTFRFCSFVSSHFITLFFFTCSFLLSTVVCYDKGWIAEVVCLYTTQILTHDFHTFNNFSSQYSLFLFVGFMR